MATKIRFEDQVRNYRGLRDTLQKKFFTVQKNKSEYVLRLGNKYVIAKSSTKDALEYIKSCLENSISGAAGTFDSVIKDLESRCQQQSLELFGGTDGTKRQRLGTEENGERSADPVGEIGTTITEPVRERQTDTGHQQRDGSPESEQSRT